MADIKAENSPPEKTEKRLPKLREGITFAFNDYDNAGKPQWMIHDPGRNKFFIIGWVEYELLERWSLGTSEAIIESVNQETTLAVDESDVENLLKFLAYNYLIQQSGYQIYQRAKSQNLFKKDNFFHWIVGYYLFFRIPLVHPDAFLQRTKKIADWIFSRKTAYIMLVLAIIALFQLSLRWEKFTHTFSTVLTLQGIFLYLIAYLIVKFFHELGHAYMCKRYGVPVPSLGIAFLVFWPVLYTDTTLSWSLNNRQRMRIALAGIQVETYVTIFAALIWCNVDNLLLQTICYLTITINWIASLLINVSPFMRFDGYYVLADYLKMPNLQPRAFALTRWQIRRWLFHWPDPPPESFTPKMHRFLVVYSIITWIYRLTLYLGIAVLVYHFFIKIVGVLLFAIEMYYFVLNPFVTEIQTWIQQKSKFSFNIHTRITLGFSIFILLIFFIPFRETVELPGTMSYAHEFLIAPAEGILISELPKSGTVIKANQPIITLQSPDLDHQLELIQRDYKKTIAELRRSSINSKYETQKGILLSNINKQQAQYKKYYALRSRFVLSVPFNGILVDVADISPGTVVMRDQWLGDVIQPNVIQIEAFISEININLLKTGMEGYFYPDNLSDTAVPVKIISIEVLNANKLSCQYSAEIKQNKKEDVFVETPCYNSSELGGLIATEMNEEGEFIPIESVYRVLLSGNTSGKIVHVARGKVLINTNSNSFAYDAFYQFKKLWVKQSGF